MVQSAKEVAINPTDQGSVERWRSANHEVSAARESNWPSGPVGRLFDMRCTGLLS